MHWYVIKGCGQMLDWCGVHYGWR